MPADDTQPQPNITHAVYQDKSDWLQVFVNETSAGFITKFYIPGEGLRFVAGTNNGNLIDCGHRARRRPGGDDADAAIQSVGVGHVLADLRRAAAVVPTHPAVRAMHEAVMGQVPHMWPSQPVGQPGYVLRQLYLQAAELAEDRLADDVRARLWSQPGPGLVPLWFGRHESPVRAVAVLPDGRVVSGGADDRVLMWDVTTRTDIAQLGCSVTALATGPLGPDDILSSRRSRRYGVLALLALVDHRWPTRVTASACKQPTASTRTRTDQALGGESRKPNLHRNPRRALRLCEAGAGGGVP